MGVKRVAQFMGFFFSLYNAYHVFAAFSRIFPQLLCTVGFSNRRKTLSLSSHICAGCFVPLDPVSSESVRQIYPTDIKCYFPLKVQQQ